jgi:transcription elongation factor GreA
VITARVVRSGPEGNGLMTQEGYDRLRRELESLTTVGRRDVAERLRLAREDGGDPAENGELLDALEEMRLLEQRISGLEGRLASAVVVSPSADGSAGIGTRVRLRTSAGQVIEYDLVGAGEADPSAGRISVESPVGQAIAGRRPGATIEVQTPRHVRRLELLSVIPAEGATLARAA